ncbi:MAG: LysM peptidoglycan-binding domain-containing protein, partial [Anaerolineae bacterium]|nr:LysM peptidoglycan-binding domain-containing protein [Anaerolineae bacterium]
VPLTPDGTGSNPGTTPRNTRYHTIKAGETLMSIAKLYNLDMYTIAAANNIYNINLIYAGTSLVIPGR